MKKLELKQMEKIEGGGWIDWACAGFAIGTAFTSVLSLGITTGIAIGMMGGLCGGYGVAGLTLSKNEEYNTWGNSGAGGKW